MGTAQHSWAFPVTGLLQILRSIIIKRLVCFRASQKEAARVVSHCLVLLRSHLWLLINQCCSPGSRFASQSQRHDLQCIRGQVLEVVTQPGDLPRRHASHPWTVIGHPQLDSLGLYAVSLVWVPLSVRYGTNSPSIDCGFFPHFATFLTTLSLPLPVQIRMGTRLTTWSLNIPLVLVDSRNQTFNLHRSVRW